MDAPQAVHDCMIVAGTFDLLHDGHYLLLHTAFAHGKHVEIWISDDAMAHVKSVKSGQFLQTYSVRCAAVAAWCDAQTPESIRLFLSSRQIELTSGLRLGPPGHPYRGRYSTHELHDAFGPSITDPSYTAITCSEETKEGCVSINSRRASAGMAPLEIVVAPLVVGPSGSKLSSTDLRARASQDGATRSTPLQPAAGHG